MLSKSQINFIKGLQQKKNRKQSGFFIVEGLKSITEFLNSDYLIDSIYFISQLSSSIPKIPEKIKLFEINEQELKKISGLQNPQGILAIIKIPEPTEHLDDFFTKPSLHLVLDGIQDPGNLGTIIRNANWFGFKHIFCSLDTVEVFNPKVVQSTMGALSKVTVVYTDLVKLISEIKIPAYGGLLKGQCIYEVTWPKEGFVIFGSEGNGISKEVENKITTAVTIPGKGDTESLNVAISCAIFCSEIQRNLLK